MKWLVLIVLFVNNHPALAQDDFFSVYTKITKARLRQKEMKDKFAPYGHDSLKTHAAVMQHNAFITDSVLPLTKQIVNLTFPDISFTDVANKNYSISDFAGREVIVNYSYLYCQSCLDRIDSTLFLLKNKKVQFLLLFSDLYQKETGDLKNYGDNVLIGFINEDTKDLISLSLGDNSMYYLNRNRQIEFFDKIDLEQHEYVWNNFLKAYTK